MRKHFNTREHKSNFTAKINLLDESSSPHRFPDPVNHRRHNHRLCSNHPHHCCHLKSNMNVMKVQQQANLFSIDEDIDLLPRGSEFEIHKESMN